MTTTHGLSKRKSEHVKVKRYAGRWWVLHSWGWTECEQWVYDYHIQNGATDETP